MAKLSFNDLLEAGVHFGHLKRKWNPNMAPYIFDEKKGILVIDLNKSIIKIEESAAALKQIAISGKKVLFVATKKQAKEIVSDLVVFSDCAMHVHVVCSVLRTHALKLLCRCDAGWSQRSPMREWGQIRTAIAAAPSPGMSCSIISMSCAFRKAV